MALPRLTGALRSFSNVTKQDYYNEESTDLTVIVCIEFKYWEIL